MRLVATATLLGSTWALPWVGDAFTAVLCLSTAACSCGILYISGRSDP